MPKLCRMKLGYSCFMGCKEQTKVLFASMFTPILLLLTTRLTNAEDIGNYVFQLSKCVHNGSGRQELWHDEHEGIPKETKLMVLSDLENQKSDVVYGEPPMKLLFSE